MVGRLRASQWLIDFPARRCLYVFFFLMPSALPSRFRLLLAFEDAGFDVPEGGDDPDSFGFGGGGEIVAAVARGGGDAS